MRRDPARSRQPPPQHNPPRHISKPAHPEYRMLKMLVDSSPLRPYFATCIGIPDPLLLTLPSLRTPRRALCPTPRKRTSPVGVRFGILAELLCVVGTGHWRRRQTTFSQAGRV